MDVQKHNMACLKLDIYNHKHDRGNQASVPANYIHDRADQTYNLLNYKHNIGNLKLD